MIAMFFGPMNPYWLISIPGILLALGAQWRLKSAYRRYSEMGTQLGLSGAQAARLILDRNGLQDIEIHEVPGELSDHYDPTKRIVCLSPDIARGNSIASVGVAAHEVGHALQYQQNYAPVGLRMALVSVTGFASQAAGFIVMGGMILRGAFGHKLLLAGIILFSVVAFFQLVTLPVEYDASSRAKRELNRLGVVTAEEAPAVSSMLHAAALTYVAALIAALLEVFQWVLLARNRNRD
ncbi:MAG: zinc metallopeptidase [Pedosphaera sp.]|nr:zinc metallopeptidase [Pedosphaera sp.]